MISFSVFRKLALSFPGASEEPHFHLISFRYKNKIFATWWEKENRAMLKLPVADQSVYCSFDKDIFFPVPGSWGAKGATFAALDKVPTAVFKEALTIAYKTVAAKN
jgi:hypothetical protein